MGTVPPFDPWELRRLCYRVTYESPGAEDPTLTLIPFSSLRTDDLFVLEAASHDEAADLDCLFVLPECERTYRATSEPYHHNDVWEIECQPV